MQALVGKGVTGGLLGSKVRIPFWKSNRGSSGVGPLSRGVSHKYLKRNLSLSLRKMSKSGEWREGEAVEVNQMKFTFLAIHSPSIASNRVTVGANRMGNGVRRYNTKANGTGEAKESGEVKDREFGATPVSESKQTIDQFRDGMRKDQARLSMEAEEPKKAQTTTSPLGTSSKPSLTTGPGSRPGNSGSSSSSSSSSSSNPNMKVKKSGRALIFVIIILGMAAGFLAVGEIGGWIDEYNGDKFKRKSIQSTEKKDWSDISKLPSNLASSLAEIDDKMVDTAMKSSFVQSIREKLGIGSSGSQNSSLSRSMASSDPNSDENLKMRAAVVLEANKDVEMVDQASKSSVSSKETSNGDETSSSIQEESNFKEENGNESSSLSTDSKGEGEEKKEESDLSVQRDLSGDVVSELKSEEGVKPTMYNESYEVVPEKDEKMEKIEKMDLEEEHSSNGELKTESTDESNNALIGKMESMAMTEENMNLLKLENEELRSVIVAMVRDLDENHKRYEEERRKEVESVSERLQNDFDGKLRILREEEAKRVMEILKAYELKLEEDVTAVVEKAMKREEDIHQEYALQVQSAIESLDHQYQEKLDEWSNALTNHVNKWQEDVLSGPISELVSEFRSSHATRLALINHINSTLDDRIHLVENYRTVAQESASFAKIAKYWILLQNKLSHSPNAPFFLQLQDFLNAYSNFNELNGNESNESASLTSSSFKSILGVHPSQIKSIIEDASRPSSLKSLNPSSNSPLASLIRASQLGIPSNDDLKSQFLEVARASRTASLAPQDANAFQHSWASLKEMFISSTSIGNPSTSNHIPSSDDSSSSSISDALSSLISSSSFNTISPSDDESTKALKRNWALLQKAGVFIAHDSFGPALEVLSQLDGTPASLMQPWVYMAQQKLMVQASLDFLASQTANLPLTPLSHPLSSSNASSKSSSL